MTTSPSPVSMMERKHDWIYEAITLSDAAKDQQIAFIKKADDGLLCLDIILLTVLYIMPLLLLIWSI